MDAAVEKVKDYKSNTKYTVTFDTDGGTAIASKSGSGTIFVPAPLLV